MLWSRTFKQHPQSLIPIKQRPYNDGAGYSTTKQRTEKRSTGNEIETDAKFELQLMKWQMLEQVLRTGLCTSRKVAKMQSCCNFALHDFDDEIPCSEHKITVNLTLFRGKRLNFNKIAKDYSNLHWELRHNAKPPLSAVRALFVFTLQCVHQTKHWVPSRRSCYFAQKYCINL